MTLSEKLQPILKGYKEYFPLHWEKEKFKWKAVQHFQTNWDIDAPNFGSMFDGATEKAKKLIDTKEQPRGMILNFANVDNEATRQMFRNLYDESQDLSIRVKKFLADAEEMRKKYDDGNWKHSFQRTNAISIYLWLRFPDKYYIFKPSLMQKVSAELGGAYHIVQNGSVESMLNGYAMYDDICAVLQGDNEIRTMLKQAIEDDEDCWPDPELRTTTIDVGYFLTDYYLKQKENNSDESEWFPQEYTPGFSVKKWIELLQDKTIFTANALQIMRRMKDYGGQATCKQLSIKYGESSNFYIAGSAALARRIVKETGCPVLQADNENSKWWPVLYTGKHADADMEGHYIWRLRPELSEALDKIDLSNVSLYSNDVTGDDEEAHGYWWLVAKPKIWSFSDLKIGEEVCYTLYNENGNKRRIFQNFLDATAGDIVIGYEATPTKKIVALGKITQANDGENLYFEKTEGLSDPIDYSTLKESPELAKMEFFAQSNGSLFKLTKGEYDFIMDMIREENPIKKSDTSLTEYSKETFLDKVYMTSDEYDSLRMLLLNKMNLILRGAPGVGKTFAAKKLAYSIMGEIDDSRIELIQFHQNYSYEDFIMGWRPDGADFKLVEGVFYRFCKKAENDPDNEYFFIIDEINRGNISKIFGELLMLIEKDYRGTKAILAYNGISFSVPTNLYLIGMMNTADRSLALIDYALRRRFGFFEMKPRFSSDGFREYQAGLANNTFDKLIEQIEDLNKAIENDPSLGNGFMIGHSYFCDIEPEQCSVDWMKSVVNYEIIPMLEEYWFDVDEEKKLNEWTRKLREIFDDE